MHIYDSDEINFLQNGDDWYLESLPKFEFNVIILYFTFTSLSTVGFGDYYPISNEERIAGAIMLLSGVAMFSYLMGQFLEVLKMALQNS